MCLCVCECVGVVWDFTNSYFSSVCVSVLEFFVCVWVVVWFEIYRYLFANTFCLCSYIHIYVCLHMYMCVCVCFQLDAFVREHVRHKV